MTSFLILEVYDKVPTVDIKLMLEIYSDVIPL